VRSVHVQAPWHLAYMVIVTLSTEKNEHAHMSAVCCSSARRTIKHATNQNSRLTCARVLACASASHSSWRCIWPAAVLNASTAFKMGRVGEKS
jgi:hypothetical protein